MTRATSAPPTACCAEATYAAYYYSDSGVLEEAFRYGALAHLLSNRQGVLPALATATQWAKQNKLRPLQTSLLLSAAENYSMAGQIPQAATILEEARLAMGRRSLGAGRIGARRNYLLATVCFQQKRVADGELALTAAMNYMRHSSFWLFHIAMADRLVSRRRDPTPRLAMDLYKEVLRDPQPGDWAADPMESLAVMVTPHPLPYEHWFEAALLAQGPRTGLGNRRPRAAAPLLQFAGLRRPAAVAPLGARRTGRSPRPAGADAAARPAGPLSGLQPIVAAVPRHAHRTGRHAAGRRRRGGPQAAKPGAWPVGRRRACNKRPFCGRWPCAASRPAWSSRRSARPKTSRSRCRRDTPSWPSSPPAGRCTPSC